MFLHCQIMAQSIADRIKELFQKQRGKSSQARSRNSRQSVEAEVLEDRCLLAAYIVDNLVDESDGNFGMGDLSLREAIEQSNASTSVDDTISFDAMLSGQTIQLDLGELEITDTVTIVGLGAEQLTISGNSQSRVFSVVSGTVTIAHLTIADGLAEGGKGGSSEFGGGGGGGAGMGGGIFVNTGASVLAQNLILSNNQAVGGDGGDAGVPGAGTSTVMGGFTSTGGVGGTSSFDDGTFGVGGAGGNGTTVDSSSGSNGTQGNFAGGGGGGGGGGYNGTGYSAGSGGDRGLTAEALDGPMGDNIRNTLGLGHGKDGSNGFDNSRFDINDNALFNPDIPAGTGGGGGGGAGLGGAIFVRSGGSLTVVDSHFEGNQAQGGQPGRRGDGLGVGLGGAIFAMDGVTVNHYGTTFGFGLERANVDSNASLFPSNPSTSLEQREGLFGTFSRTLPSLTYVDSPPVAEFQEYTYLNPGVRNPYPIDILDMDFNVIGEDRTGGTKTTVSDILDRLGRGGLREEVASPVGMAIVSLDSSNGFWQLNGVTISNVTESNALLVESSDELSFTPNDDFATYFRTNQPKLTFRAWDGTGGVSGDRVDTTTNGSGTAFSTTIATAVVDISDPIQFIGPVNFFGNEATLFLPTDAFFTTTFASAAFPTSGSQEFNYTITGVGGVWSGGPRVTSLDVTINPSSNGSYLYGYENIRLGTFQFGSTSAFTTGPGTVSQSIFNANVRIGDFVAAGQDSGAIAIIRSKTALDNSVTHFQVTNITGGTLYKDAGFTQAVTDGEFLSYQNGNVYLYFRPDANFTGDATFQTIDSTSANDSGLQVGDHTVTTGGTTDALTITRSNPTATHFKVSNITNGKLYSDAGLTQEVTNNSFVKFSSEVVTLYFKADSSVRRGEGSFDVQESTTNADSGLLASPTTTTITILPPRTITVLNSIIRIDSIAESYPERDSGTTTVDFVVSRGSVSGDLPEATYGYEVTSSNMSDNDFVGGMLPTGIVTFAAGQEQAVISIEVTRDAIIEDDESFTITLTGLPTSNFDTSNTAATATITNDDVELIVDALGDVDDGDLSAGQRTLREIIRVANLREGADEITFDSSLMGQTILLENGRLEITEDVTLTGLGANQLTIDGQGNHQIFYVDGRTNGAISVTIAGVTLTGGYANDVGGGTSSGVNNSTRGGAIFNDLGNVTLSNTVLTANTADINGGAVFTLGGTVTITGSTLSNNSATIHGGAIYNDGSLAISNSTLSGNIAAVNGGGIYNSGDSTITNSTLSGNTANNNGGAIHNSDETIVLTNTTVLGNRADADGMNGGTGGGLWTFNDGFTFTTLYNTIVAGNVQGAISSDSANDIANKNVESGSVNNLIGDPNSSGGLTHGSGSNIVGQDDGMSGRELLDLTGVIETTLADNGGPTLTHALVLDSLAINAGNNSRATTPGDDGISGTMDTNETALTTDQRGTGFNRIEQGTVDIGAYEWQLPSLISISADSMSKAEGNSGQTAFTFTVTRSQKTEGTTTVDYAVTGDANAADFGGTLPSGTVTFNDGETSKTITIQVSGDTTVELDEPFTVTLSNASGHSVINTSTASSTITNDDTASVSINDVSVSEGDSGTKTLTFTVTLDKALPSGFTVDYATANNTATTADSDYTSASNTLTFVGNAGETQMFSVTVNGDTKVEGNETFFANLSNIQAGALSVSIGDGQGVGTINNDDSATLSINDMVGTEGSGTLTFTVSLSGIVAEDVSVDFATAVDTANSNDFVAANSTATISAGDLSTTVTITINDNVLVERTEQFFVNLSNVQGGFGSVTINDGQGIGTIIDNDALVVSALGPETTPNIRAFNPTANVELFNFMPYSADFRGGVHVTTGDVNNDGTPDIIAGAGFSGGPHVRVFDGTNPNNILMQFFAFDPNFRGGVYVASADLNDDGHADIITGMGEGGAPLVRVYSGANGSKLFDFAAYNLDFVGGVRVAAGDITHDGTADIITAPGAGGGPNIRVFDGSTPQLGGNLGTDIGGSLGNFMAYDPVFRGGVYVAAGDVNGDGRIDLITGADAGGGPNIHVYDSATGMKMTGPIGDFFAFGESFTGGVRVAASDLNNDGKADVIAGAGMGGGPHVRIFDAASTGSTPDELHSFFAANGSFRGGVFVAGDANPESVFTLQLADGYAPADNAPSLNPTDVAPVFEAALDRLEAVGLSAQTRDALSQLTIEVTDLGGNRLGESAPGTIRLDVNAAGRGWYIDPTPQRDEEFAGINLQAVDPDAIGRVDLLTVILHELAHQLGADHVEGNGHLLSPTLPPSTRRLPETEGLDQLFANNELLGELLN